MKLIWVTFITCATLVRTSQTTVRRLMVVLQTSPHRPSLRTTWILVHISGNLTYMATWYHTVIKYTIADAWHFIYNTGKWSRTRLKDITSYLIAAECTIYLHCFQNVLDIFKISFQIGSECANQRPYFQKFPDCRQPTSHPLMKSNHVLFFLLQY